MTGTALREARLHKGWTQTRAAKELGVSQAYVALLEKGRRQPSPSLSGRLVRELGVAPTIVPAEACKPTGDANQLARDLANLGYPGFQHLRSLSPVKNPAVVLFAALREDWLEPRVAEALPWLLFRYPDLDWNWLLPNVKQNDLQNRLGFVVSVARTVAETRNATVASILRKQESALERSRLVREDVFGRSRLTDVERRWLRQNRTTEAEHWNVLSNLRPEHLTSVD